MKREARRAPGAVIVGSNGTGKALAERQQSNNLETADHWQLYAEHRIRVDALIQSPGSDARLCVLGAGNCNSFELASLTQRFAEVHLCDLDSAALNRAVKQLSGAARNKLHLHAPVDVSGVLTQLPTWAEALPTVDALRALPEAVEASLSQQLPGPFEVVVSEGLLSQIAFTCALQLGGGPAVMRVLPFVLLAHLRILLALTRPGGNCVLITDTASTEGVPEVSLSSDSARVALLQALDAQGKLFTGTSPTLLRRALGEKGLAERVKTVHLSSPWTWQLLKARTSLTYGLQLTRSQAG